MEALLMGRARRVRAVRSTDLSSVIARINEIRAELESTIETMQAHNVRVVQFDGAGKASRALVLLSEFSADVLAQVKKAGRRV